MHKQSILLALLLCSILSFSQEIINSLPLAMEKKSEVFQVVNALTKQTTLFFGDKNRIKAILLDDKMKFIDSISALKPEKDYSRMLGSSNSNAKSTLFWSSSNQKKVFSQSFDFKNSQTSGKTFSLEFKNEIYLQDFSVGNKFMILSLLKESNIFKLYIFDDEGNLDIKDIDISSAKFYHRSNLYSTFEDDFMPFEKPFSLEKINTETPNSLSNTSKKRKLYIVNNQINITIDTDQNYTQLIQIDLENYSVTSKNILQTPFKNFGTPDLNFNSFLLYNKLYQIKSSSNKFYLTIKDLNGNLLKEYSATADNPIDFKNSEIYQDGGDFGNKRTLEKSSQFIRKINSLHSGVSCYIIDQNTLITLGGVSAEQQSTGQSVMNQFGLIGSLIGTLISPTMESFNSYSNRKVVKIEGLFDKEGNHIKGELQPLAFDKIKLFLEKNTDAFSQTLYKVENIYYFGCYDNTTKEYIIRKFTD